LNNDIVIDISDVSFSYEKKITLKDIDLKIKKNDFLAVLGPNGGGKSTLLKLILGLLKPDSGRIRIFGQENKKVIKRIGYVPQNISEERFPVSVRDVIIMGLDSKMNKRIREDRIEKTAEIMGITDLLNKHVHDLSGGQRQRAFIARALISDPEILLLDEPTASIDGEGQIRIYEILKDLNVDKTIVMVSHDLNLITKYANTITVVNQSACHHKNENLPENFMDLYYQCPVDILQSSLKEGHDHD